MITGRKPLQPSPHLQQLIAIALEAGREIMHIYEGDFAKREKADLSPVTEADELAERVILARLAAFDPATPVISEEAAAAGHMPEVGTRFYLVDPLDGTKEFISRNGEFTVNIALVESGTATLGVVYAPAIGRLFWGDVAAKQAGQSRIEDGVAGSHRSIHVRTCPHEGAVVVASRSHRDAETDNYLNSMRVQKLISAGSSLKFCLVASGEADLYPRFGRTMEWDTAAGHAIVLAAGGSVVTADGAPLTYGKQARGLDNPAFIVRG